jgi:hypothetical protein
MYYFCIFALNNQLKVVMSNIEEEIIQKIQARAEAGKQKYGTTMARKDLTFKQWVQHLQEELLDAAIYAEKLLDEISIPEMKKRHDNKE